MKHSTSAAPAVQPGNSSHLPEIDGVRHRFVDLPGLRMHIAEAGKGEPVLLLHGALQHWWAWRGIIPALAERYRVLAPDLRGSGWTDAPASGYTRPRMVADLVAALDDLGVRNVRLISHDMGAIPGFGLCYDHPERVRAHVAIGVPPLAMKVGLRHVKAFLPLWHQQVGAIPLLAPALLGRGTQPLARHMLGDFSPVGKPPDPDEVEAYLARLRLPGRAGAVSASFRHLVLPELARIAAGRYRRGTSATPTLVLTGAEDRAFPPSMAEDLVRTAEPYVDSVALQTVDGAAHYVAEENPVGLLTHLLPFLAEVPAAR
jgi:pimeloyl-ACP methyl ester carboxylesterase